ncbi:MAG: hypothetical protein K5768_04885 [Firmicutes bacterium]|nr:hypothetical protein [Bacillota bacterium]
MDKETIILSQDEYKIIGSEEVGISIEEHYSDVSIFAKPFVEGAKIIAEQIEKALYKAPAFINLIKASIPEQTYQAVLTKAQKEKIAKGALKLMTKKDGSLIANLIDTKTKKIVSQVSLKSVKISPEITQAMTNYASQMQMAQIAEQIKTVQKAIEEVRHGQEFDRLATAYSCQQKLLQAMEIKSPELKASALLRIANDAEDSRNLLMQSQIANLNYVKKQPESFIEKIIKGINTDKIDQRMNEIRDGLSAINLVSLAEAMAYQELGESSAARQSLIYYAEYLDKAYLSTKGLVERLDLIDASTENYWSKSLPTIKKQIAALPAFKQIDLIER